MNGSSINQFNCKRISHNLNFGSYFCEGLKLTENCFRPLVNLFHDTFATTNLSRKQFSASNLSDLRVRKEMINKLLICLICLKIFCSKIMFSRKNKIYFWRMVTKLRMFSVTQESVTMSVGRDRKIRTALRTNQIARFVIVPSKKEVKNYTQNWFSVQQIVISIRPTLMVIVITWI